MWISFNKNGEKRAYSDDTVSIFWMPMVYKNRNALYVFKFLLPNR